MSKGISSGLKIFNIVMFMGHATTRQREWPMNRVTAHLFRNGGKTALRFAPFLARRETQVLPPAIFSRVSVRSYYTMTKYQVVPLTFAQNINFNQPGVGILLP